jgi:uncharacterized protein
VSAAESETVRIIRLGYDAFNRGDFEGAVSLMHPDVELRRPEMSPESESGPLRGPEAVRAWMMPDIFERQQVEVEEIVENGDKVLVGGRIRVRARGSGIEVDDQAFHIWTIRDGKAARLEFYSDRSQALKAAGLRATGESSRG